MTVKQASIKRHFEALGFTPTEASVYLHSLRSGPSSVQEIAREIKENRVTVHSALERLIEKGLVFETRKGRRRLLVAEDPDVLSQVLERKRDEFRQLERHQHMLVDALQSIQRLESGRPTVKFLEGVDGLKRMLEDTLSSKGEVLVFTYVDLFSQILRMDYLEDYFRRRAAKGVHTRLIFPPCEFADRVHPKSKEYRIQIRLMPKGVTWNSGIFSWNNCIAIKSLSAGRPTCTIIENADVAYFYRNVIYELCWRQSEPYRRG